MQVHPGGPGGGVAHPVHQLGQRGARLTGQRVPGMAKIMDMNRREPSFGQRPRPGLGEVAAPELATLDTDKDKAVRPIARESVEVPPQLGDDQFGEDDRADLARDFGVPLTSCPNS